MNYCSGTLRYDMIEQYVKIKGKCYGNDGFFYQHCHCQHEMLCAVRLLYVWKGSKVEFFCRYHHFNL